jgi:hypothetical protein
MVERRILKWTLAGMLVLGMVVPMAAHEVGWILMVPPIIVYGDDIPSVSIGAPLSEWEIDKPFDTARECKEYRLKVYEDADKELDKFYSKKGARLDAYGRAKPYRYSHARCVPASVVYPQAEEK